MNNEGGAIGGQPGPQQQPMQQRSLNVLIRPEQIQILPHLDQQQKQKLEQLVKGLYSRLAARPPDSDEYKMAYKRLHEWTLRLRQDVNAWKMRMTAQQQAGSQPRMVGPDQQQPQSQRPQSQSGHPGVAQQQPQQPQQPINAAVMQHVQSFNYVLPPDMDASSPEGEKTLANFKTTYLNLLTKQEQAANTLKHLTVAIDQRKTQGLEIPPEVIARKSQAETSYNQVKLWADDFRKKQVAWARARNERQQQHQQQNGANHNNNVKPEGSTQPDNGQQHNQQQSQNQQGQGQQQNNLQSQPPKTDVGENSKNEMNPKVSSESANATNADQQAQQQQEHLRRVPPQQQQSGQQQEQLSSAQQGQPQAKNLQQTPGQGAAFTSADPAHNSSSVQVPAQQQRPQPNYPQQRTFAPGEQPQYSNGQLPSPKTTTTPANSIPGHPSYVQPQHQQQPQSATSGVGPLGNNNNGTNGSTAGGGPPVALSQSAALSAAARQYTDSRGGVSASSGSGSYMQLGNREQNTNPKMPIAKTLNVSAPQPVAMGPARPTMAGPTNGGPIGVMGQPAIPKAPGYVLEGDGDRVLSKKKLDELVRQVTGSGSGGVEAGMGEGEGLTPEVEDVSRQIFLYRTADVRVCLQLRSIFLRHRPSSFFLFFSFSLLLHPLSTLENLSCVFFICLQRYQPFSLFKSFIAFVFLFFYGRPVFVQPIRRSHHTPCTTLPLRIIIDS